MIWIRLLWMYHTAKRPELDQLDHFQVQQADQGSYGRYGSVRPYESRSARSQDFVIEDLSNWYIRRARRRFWAEELDEDKKSVYATTYEVLVGLSQLIAPFAPFISEEIYQKLTGEESVHLAFFPKADEALIDEKARRKNGSGSELW